MEYTPLMGIMFIIGSVLFLAPIWWKAVKARAYKFPIVLTICVLIINVMNIVVLAERL